MEGETASKDNLSIDSVGKINRLAIASLCIGVFTLLLLFFLVIVGQYNVRALDDIGEYFFLGIPFVGLIGLITGAAAFTQIKLGNIPQRGLRYSAIGIFLSLTTLVIFFLIFLAI